MNIKAYLAEFMGAFALIFIGVGAIAANEITGGALGITGIALAHGLTIGVMVAATATISGAHLNPAVTISLFVAKKIDAMNAAGYIVFQCLGAIFAAFLIKMAIPENFLTAVNMGTPGLNIEAGITVSMALVTEIVLTFFLMIVIYMTAVDSRGSKMAPLYIGLTIVLDIFMGGPISGAAMNPARHLGPALMGGGFENVWIYWVGPIVGSLIAFAVYKLVFEEKTN